MINTTVFMLDGSSRFAQIMGAHNARPGAITLVCQDAQGGWFEVCLADIFQITHDVRCPGCKSLIIPGRDETMVYDSMWHHTECAGERDNDRRIAAHEEAIAAAERYDWEHAPGL